jgi:CTP synthase (UTP-ammonia lyase)
VLVEHARSMCGIGDAAHAEYGAPGAQIVSLLACSLSDNVITIELTEGSRLLGLYGAVEADERTTCNYGLNPDFTHIVREQGLRPSAFDDTGEVRAVERDDHPFFVGTLFQPQLSTSPERPHPIWTAFANAVMSHH